jgi:hypothetical protein
VARILRRSCAFLVTLMIATVPAFAITNGQADGTLHPEVGALIADQAYSDGTWAYCSGTLISPTVFVTAAHCGDPGQTTARVSFAAQYVDGKSKVYVGRYVPDPSYQQKQSDPHDIAVVVFSKAVQGIAPASLPSAGLLDQMRQNGTLQTSSFTAVGYGSLDPQNGSGGKTYIYNDARNYAGGSFNTLTNAWLKLSQNASHGDGGTCYGDSGGANFLGGVSSQLLVADTITGDTACVSTNVDYRLDTPAARDFLKNYVQLP